MAEKNGKKMKENGEEIREETVVSEEGRAEMKLSQKGQIKSRDCSLQTTTKHLHEWELLHLIQVSGPAAVNIEGQNLAGE